MRKYLVFCILFCTIFFGFADEDVDALFEDAEDVEAVIEEPVKKENKDTNPTFNLSGSISTDTGFYFLYPADPDYFTAGAKFTNTINFSGRSSPAFGVYGSIVTTESNLTLDLASFYFDYLFLNTILITGGKKSLGWGNLLINTSNILSGSEKSLSVQILYPLEMFTLTFIGLYNPSLGGTPNLSSISYAGCIEATVFSTALKLFARKWAQIDVPDSLAAGLEWKRTIFTVDIYQHALMHMNTSLWSTDSFTLISGFARIWEFSKKIALVAEHRFDYDVASQKQIHIIAVQTGMSRLFGDKLKLGLSWNHNILESSGAATFAAILPGAAYKGLPDAELQIGLPVTYSASGVFTAKLGANISLSMSY